MAARIEGRKENERLTSLPDFIEDESCPCHDYTSFCILLGKEKVIFNHSGNKRFRAIVNYNACKYMDAPTKSLKTQLVTRVFGDMKKAGFRFLKRSTSTDAWQAIKQADAREKVSHALRDRVRELQKPTTKRRKQAMLKKAFKKIESDLFNQSVTPIVKPPTKMMSDRVALSIDQSLKQRVQFKGAGLNSNELCSLSFQDIQQQLNIAKSLSIRSAPCKEVRKEAQTSVGKPLKEPFTASSNIPTKFSTNQTIKAKGSCEMMSSSNPGMSKTGSFGSLLRAGQQQIVRKFGSAGIAKDTNIRNHGQQASLERFFGGLIYEIADARSEAFSCQKNKSSDNIPTQCIDISGGHGVSNQDRKEFAEQCNTIQFFGLNGIDDDISKRRSSLVIQKVDDLSKRRSNLVSLIEDIDEKVDDLPVKRFNTLSLAGPSQKDSDFHSAKSSRRDSLMCLSVGEFTLDDGSEQSSIDERSMSLASCVSSLQPFERSMSLASCASTFSLQRLSMLSTFGDFTESLKIVNSEITELDLVQNASHSKKDEQSSDVN
eukprot:CAMPEP_0194218328 /NCGR_PEP_ID=MMETSP0156-20130528/23540_1 /TAXON_ID=33649 /ORGANISM="Thalassionema nitzschioides, Strain L26-B" /LENGTH=542 /DNA_ID=CAMNT_0038947641 /DNA_START=49 /DNA_END=1677 /DNA_ORIENTATION=-